MFCFCLVFEHLSGTIVKTPTLFSSAADIL